MLSYFSLHSSKVRLPPYSKPSSISHSIHRSSIVTQKQTSKCRSLCVRALDAAQPYVNDPFKKSKKLKIAIVGFGEFGQYLAKTLVRQGHTVLAHSRSDYSDVARKSGVLFFTDADDLCEEHPEIKEFPRKLFLKVLPPEFDVLCTHPMFGQGSGKDSWKSLPFVYDKVRIGDEELRISRCEKFLNIFAQEGCKMVEMSCAQHDRDVAESQFITHTMGRILENFGLESTSINTKGYEALLNLVENTFEDNFELYYCLFMYNKHSMEQLERLDMAFESLKKQLFGHINVVLRKQLFKNAEAFDESSNLKLRRKQD